MAPFALTHNPPSHPTAAGGFAAYIVCRPIPADDLGPHNFLKADGMSVRGWTWMLSASFCAG
jgi:hypothetical protein